MTKPSRDPGQMGIMCRFRPIRQIETAFASGPRFERPCSLGARRRAESERVWGGRARNSGRSGPDPALRIETESVERPPWRARGGGLAAQCVNDKAPVTFDEGLELPD